MKTLKLITLGLFLSLSFFSCSNDDDNERDSTPTTQELLAHKWYFSKQLSVGSGDLFIANICDKNTYYEFLITGEFYAEFFQTESDASCVSGGINSATYEIGEFEGEDAFTITFEDGSTERTLIISISETELVIEQRGFGIRQTTFTKR